MREERRGLPRVDERHRRTGHLAEHRVRQADLRRSGCSARWTWRSSWACGPTRCRAPPATTTRRATRAWPTSSSGRTWARSRWARSRSTRWSSSNVAATLASGGVWCPPNPIDKVFDRHGKEVAVTTETCEQVVPEGLANTLANAMSKDDQGGGTAAGSAGSAGWDLPMSGKTGTTEAHRSSAFLGFTNTLRRPPTTSTTTPPTPGDLCSFPLRQCGSGNLFGGNEPARTWFTAMKPIANNYGPVALPPTDPRYVDGAPGSRVPSVVGHDAGHRRASGSRRPASRSPTRPTRSTAPRRTARWSGRPRLARRCPARSSRSRSPTASRRHRLRRRPVRSPGLPWAAAGDRLDGRRDPWAATDHRAGARSAAATTAATAVIGL